MASEPFLGGGGWEHGPRPPQEMVGFRQGEISEECLRNSFSSAPLTGSLGRSTKAHVLL